MRVFEIVVNAKILQKRWNDLDQEVYTEIFWNGHFEIEHIENLEKLLSLNSPVDKEILMSNIPSSIFNHIDYDRELNFDEIHDTIINLHTRMVKELEQ